MAYKFQGGDAILSGSLEINGTGNDLTTSDQSGDEQFKATAAGVVSGSGAARFNSLQIDRGVGAGAVITSAGAFAGTGLSGSGASSLFSVAVPSDGNVTISGELRMGNNANGRILNADGNDFASHAVSGDIASVISGAFTIAAGAVTVSKMADMAANTVLVRDANSAGSPSAKAVADTQLLIGDGTGFTAAALSGDVTMTNAGVVTITASAVESGMLNNNVISGQSELASGLALTDELMVSDAGTLKRMDISLIAPAIAGSGLSAVGGKLTTEGGTVTALVTTGQPATSPLAEGTNFLTASIPDSTAVVFHMPSGSDGDKVTVKAKVIGDGSSVEIRSSGSALLDGEAGLFLESSYAAVTLVYCKANDWRII